MPEINNSLALQVQPQTLDFGNTLQKASQIRSLNAHSSLEEQSVQHNQDVFDRNNNYSVPEVQGLAQTKNIQAETAGKNAELAGRLGNILTNDPSPKGVATAVGLARQSGIDVHDLVHGHLDSLPPDQIKAAGQRLVDFGRTATVASEQDPNLQGQREAERNRQGGAFIPQNIPPNEPIISRTEAATGGRRAPPVIQMTDRMVPNADGSLPTVLKQPAAPSFKDRYSGADMFTPSVVKGPDGSISSSVTPATTALQGQATARYAKAGENADNAQALTTSLDMMDHSADVLNSAGWSSTGAGANAKMGAAKSVNSMLQTFGLPPAVDPTKISSWEDLTKETTRAGFKLASTLGSREAASIVQSSVGAVPSAENSPLGFKLVTSGIRQAIQREKDYYAFATDYAQSHRGNTFGADVEFNKKFPPELYAKTAIANSIPPEAVKMMKSDPKLAEPFDAKYGAGMSGFILHHDQVQ